MGSKFFSIITYTETPADVEMFLISVKKEHPTATHHCYAYLLNPNESVEFSNDDGKSVEHLLINLEEVGESFYILQD